MDFDIEPFVQGHWHYSLLCNGPDTFSEPLASLQAYMLPAALRFAYFILTSVYTLT
jgi:hypothetical protein